MGISPIGTSCLCLLLLLNVAHGVHDNNKDSKIVPAQALGYHGNGRTSLLRGAAQPSPAMSFLTIEGSLNHQKFVNSVRGLLVRLEYLDFQDQQITGRPYVPRPQYAPTYVFRPLNSNANANVVSMAALTEMTATTGGDGTTGSSDTPTDTSAILDSYRDLEERVASLEDGGVTRTVEAGDAIAAAKAQAEALIRAALQDVANGAQAQAAAQAADALNQAAQDQANQQQQTSTAPTSDNSSPPPASTSTATNSPAPGDNTQTGGGNNNPDTGGGGGSNTVPVQTPTGTDNNPGATGPGCCTDAINQINDLRQEVDQLKSIAAGLQNGGGGNVVTSTADNTPPPPPVMSSAPVVTPPDVSSAPVVTPPPSESTAATVTPPPSTTGGGGNSIIDTTAECNGNIDASKAVVDPKVVEEEAAAHAAETEALLKDLPLTDKLSIDPKLLRDSNQLVTDVNNKHTDFADQLASDCAEPTCPVPGSGPVTADTTS